MNNLLNESIEVDLNNKNEQESFFESTFGKIIDFSIDTGIRALLPDFIENEVINIKNTIINEGFSEGVKSIVTKAIDIGKSALGVVTNNFESVSQAEKAIEKGGIIDSISSALNLTLDKVNDKGLLPKTTTSTIKDGKDVILNNISSNIKKEFESQNKNMEKLNTYVNDWKAEYERHDIEGMDKYMKKIKSIMKKVMPIEKLIKETRAIENLHDVIKSNGNNFDLSDDELELANILT